MDNSQTITTDELLLVMKNLGMMATKDEVKDMLSEVDEDGTFSENVERMGSGVIARHMQNRLPLSPFFSLSLAFCTPPSGK